MPTVPRIQLIPVHPQHLLALVEDPDSFQSAFGFAAADGLRSFFVSGEVPQEWFEQLRAAPGPDPWRFGFAIVHEASGQVVGMASFKGPPDAENGVEIAYAVVPAFEGQGIATEAARALLAFASTQPVALVRAHTLPQENASTRVLSKCGFRRVGQVEDPHDGPVWRWEYAAGERR